ncbi:MAG TPA: DUF885 domain-containing protein [Candidatus Limnocylindria bacterium]|nr:DUF885 domain-containing protein [Candidatus Limnocylindria bacterium]
MTAELDRLAEEFWDTLLAAEPAQGTAFGDHRYGDRLSDISPAGRAALKRRFEEIRDAAAALPPEADVESALTQAALRHAVEERLALLAADPHSFTVDAMAGAQASFLSIPSYQPLRDVADGESMLARWWAMGPWVDQQIAQLRRGAAEGRAPVAGSVRRVIAQLDELLARPLEEWPLLAPLRAEHAGWTEGAWRAFEVGLAGAVRDGLRPALAHYRAYLADEAVGGARDEAHVGICHLPGGTETYATLARAHTTTERSPQEIHDIGLAEIALIDAEIAELGGRVLGAPDLAATLAALRGDPSLHFATADEIVAVAEASLARAVAAIPEWFGRLPQAECVVVRMEPHEEQHSTIAYYRQPPQDGSRPGSYYINTYAPQTRPRYEAEALAFHESVPGHHLQVAIGQELEHLPAFRRHAETTAYVEGWGLYTERLSDEMGLYSDDLDRIGMLSYDAWRASRLVVDTGMHALGWSRGQAIEFMTSHTALGLNNIANEVDRYIGWPGQALAYKIGQLEIRRLRTEAEAALGASFDIRRFHDAVLGHGALPLAVLRESVARDLGLVPPE